MRISGFAVRALVFITMMSMAQGCSWDAAVQVVSPVYLHDVHLSIQSAYKTPDDTAVLLVEGRLERQSATAKYTIRVPMPVLRHDETLDARSLRWLRDHRTQFDGSREFDFYYDARFNPYATLGRPHARSPQKYGDAFLASVAPDSLVIDRESIEKGWPQLLSPGCPEMTIVTLKPAAQPKGIVYEHIFPRSFFAAFSAPTLVEVPEPQVAQPPPSLQRNHMPVKTQKPPATQPSATVIPGSGERFLFAPGKDMVCSYIPAQSDARRPPISIYSLPRKTHPNLVDLAWVPAFAVADAGICVIAIPGSVVMTIGSVFK